MKEQQRIPKILVISSDTGGGHRSAAAAIVAGVQKFLESESYAIRVVRAVEESHHLSAKLVRLYNWILRNRQHSFATFLIRVLSESRWMQPSAQLASFSTCQHRLQLPAISR